MFTTAIIKYNLMVMPSIHNILSNKIVINILLRNYLKICLATHYLILDSNYSKNQSFFLFFDRYYEHGRINCIKGKILFEKNKVYSIMSIN